MTLKQSFHNCLTNKTCTQLKTPFCVIVQILNMNNLVVAVFDFIENFTVCVHVITKH